MRFIRALLCLFFLSFHKSWLSRKGFLIITPLSKIFLEDKVIWKVQEYRIETYTRWRELLWQHMLIFRISFLFHFGTCCQFHFIQQFLKKCNFSKVSLFLWQALGEKFSTHFLFPLPEGLLWLWLLGFACMICIEDLQTPVPVPATINFGNL